MRNGKPGAWRLEKSIAIYACHSERSEESIMIVLYYRYCVIGLLLRYTS